MVRRVRVGVSVVQLFIPASEAPFGLAEIAPPGGIRVRGGRLRRVAREINHPWNNRVKPAIAAGSTRAAVKLEDVVQITHRTRAPSRRDALQRRLVEVLGTPAGTPIRIQIGSARGSKAGPRVSRTPRRYHHPAFAIAITVATVATITTTIITTTTTSAATAAASSSSSSFASGGGAKQSGETRRGTPRRVVYDDVLRSHPPPTERDASRVHRRDAGHELITRESSRVVVRQRARGMREDGAETHARPRRRREEKKTFFESATAPRYGGRGRVLTLRVVVPFR